MKKYFKSDKTLKTAFLALMILVIGIGPAIAQDKFPNKKVEIIVPFTVGGGTDAWARTFAAALASKKYFGVNVVVNNVPGGQDLRGIGEAYNAKPDGHTLVAFNPPSSPFAWYLHRPKWDIRDLTGITVYARDPLVLVATQKYEHKDFKSLLDALKAGDSPKVGLSGLGGMEHIAVLLLNKRYNVKLDKLIPYNATSDVISALIRNEVDIAFGSLTAMHPAIEDGKLVAIAVAGQTERSGTVPDVPTFSEFGDPMIELAMNRGIYGPPGIPENIRKTLEETFIKVQTKDVLLKARFDAYNLKPANGTGEEAEEILGNSIKLAEELQLEKLLRK